MDAALESWIFAHSYLAPMAAFREEVDRALASQAGPAVAPPPFDAYAPEYGRGVPLLASAAAPLDLAPAGALLERLVVALAKADVPPKLAADLRDLARHGGAGAAPDAVVGWLTGRGEAPAAHPGLLRFLGWSALARALRPALDAFEAWRDDARWRRAGCPACGATPAMAQLLGDGALTQRRLACGCCGTRWGYARLGCPYCGDEDPARIDVFELEEEPQLRIDACRACGGYLKTYAGAGDEGLLLADWTTLHLDVLAKDRGLARKGASLYEL